MDEYNAIQIAQQIKGHSIDGWEIGNYIGSGKSAFVCECHNDTINAAIKIYDSNLIRQFGEETQLARIQRQLDLVGKDHENLVKIYDGGCSSNSEYYYLVMERVNGRPLSELIKDYPREKIAPTISQIASASHFLEELHLVHRDIKPENICVSENYERAVLLDFGVIRPFAPEKLTDGTGKLPFLGTLQYSPPEYLLREENDSIEGWRAITFYQLGAVMHDLIMRYPLFQKQQEPYGKLVQAVCNEIPNVQATDVEPDLIRVTKLCLTKDPTIRIRYLKWEDFEFGENRNDDIKLKRSRIKKRYGLSDSTSENLGGNYKLNRRNSYEIIQTFGELVRNICITDKHLPPITLKQGEWTCENTTKYTLIFDESEKYSLITQLQIIFELNILDPETKLIQVSAIAILGEAGAFDEMPQNRNEVYEGIYEEKCLEKEVEKIIINYFDEGQSMSEKPETNDILEKNLSVLLYLNRESELE